ncbi:MAG: phenylalanine--tRNA ligase subunit beta [Betaproteobacteria bacterium]|nr:phenylalanine--tRNA ligase subunit beta [Betaproteobacteria bacterium]
MQFPESWLREFCNPPLTTEQLADKLTMAGLEVEDMRPVAPVFTKVVVGEIKSAEQHPDADRLKVCQVLVGQSQLLQIVCGAPNARAGIKVACALVGSELPPGDSGEAIHIKLGKLRGVESQGMLCSSKELKLADDSVGLLELSGDAPVGQDIRAYLNLDDTLFTLKLTPNLAHCLSVFGIARELSALTGSPLITPKFSKLPVTSNDLVGVEIQAPELCGRFSGRVVRHVNSKAKTPVWMVDRLARCGQRSVSPLVDISNYVMFELGRPSHIFDLSKIHGGLVVRWAQDGEKLKLLNGTTVTLDGQVGVIADEQQVESLAGIMGGDATAVSNETQDIFIEAAFWWPQSVIGRSRKFHFSTEAGHRFERGVDPALTVQHIEHITALVLSICGNSQTTVGEVMDQQINMPLALPVTLRVERACKVLGMSISQQVVVDTLRSLGLALIEEAPGIVTVTPPSYRFDIKMEEDLIEEVARMIGYENLPSTPPCAPIVPKLLPESQRNPFTVRRQLATLGYLETINFSFVDAKWEHTLAGNPNPIELLNPIASQMGVMRSSLMASLLHVAKFNLDRKASRVRLFEIGRVFLRDESILDSLQTVAGIDQPMRVAGLALGPKESLGWNTDKSITDFFDVKADVCALMGQKSLTFVVAEHPALHPGRCARIEYSGQAIGWLGELHPRWRQQWDFSHAPVLFELALDAVLLNQVALAKPVAKLQAVERDLALVVDESVTHQALMDAIWLTPLDGLLEGAVLFDVYRPPKPGGSVAMGEKSLAVRITLQSQNEMTLTDPQIESAVQAIVSHLFNQLNAKLRA